MGVADALGRAETAKYLLVLGTLLSLALIGVVFGLARREETRRKTAEEQLRTVNADLERRVHERTQIQTPTLCSQELAPALDGLPTCLAAAIPI